MIPIIAKGIPIIAPMMVKVKTIPAMSNATPRMTATREPVSLIIASISRNINLNILNLLEILFYNNYTS